jgi:hypothetical protein
MIKKGRSQKAAGRRMKRTQFIRNNAKLQGGKKPPKPKEYPQADDIYAPPPRRANQVAEKQIDKAMSQIRDTRV